MKKVFQKPTDLRLAILRTELPVNLTILDQAAIDIDAWKFSFYIVGESHLVRIEHRGALVLQEVLACIDMPPACCISWRQFQDLKAYRYGQDNYEVAVSFADQPDWTIPPKSSASCLEVVFPALHHHIPVTQVQWQMTSNTVYWWTLHVYPEARRTTRVHSRSEFRCC